MLYSYPAGEHKTVGSYHALGILGEGGFGVVYAAHNHEKLDEGLFAVKEPSKETSSVKRFEAEVKALKILDGGYFPKLKENWEGPPPGYAAELIRGLSIADLMKPKLAFGTPAIWRIGYDLASALIELENRKM